MHATVVVANDQVSSDLDGEAVILHLGNGVYYSLNETGTRIWNLIHRPTRVEAIYTTLMNEYDVAADQCQHELLTMLQTLAKAGLVEVDDAASV